LPIGNWSIVWNFSYASTIDRAVGVSLSQLVDVTNYFTVTGQPTPALTNPSQCAASGTNILGIPLPLPAPSQGTPPPFSQPITAFGYYIEVKDAGRERASINSVIYDPSIAVVQDPIVG